MINLRTAIVASAVALAFAAPASAGYVSSGGWSSSGGTCKKHCGSTTSTSTGGTTTSTGGTTTSTGGTTTSSGGTTTSSSGGGTPVPEPADFALFAAGVAGLLIGRRTSRRRRAQ